VAEEILVFTASISLKPAQAADARGLLAEQTA